MRKLYVQVPFNQKSVTLLRADKIKEIRDIFPNPQLIASHIQLEKSLMEKDKKYPYHPFDLTINKEDFEAILRAVKSKLGLDYELNVKKIMLVLNAKSGPVIEINLQKIENKSLLKE